MINNYSEGRFTEEQTLALARNAYRNGEATFKVDPRRCAMLVIDMQDEFVRPHWGPDWVPDATRKAPRIRGLIDECRRSKIPVIYTVYSKTHNYLDRPKTGSTMPGRFPEVAVDPSHFFTTGDVWHEVAPMEGEIVIHKPSYGAFYDTPLETILRNMGVDTVIVTGCITTYCCSMTARQAYERGFKVIFGSDLTGIDDPDLMEHELMIMRKGFARVLSCGEILCLIGSGGDPEGD